MFYVSTVWPKNTSVTVVEYSIANASLTLSSLAATIDPSGTRRGGDCVDKELFAS